MTDALKRGRNWLLTANLGSYKIETTASTELERINDMFNSFKIIVKEKTSDINKGEGIRAWRVAQERGTAGNYHLQAVISLHKAQRFSYMQKLLLPVIEGAHWEVCRNAKASWDYCGREGKEGWVSELIRN